MASKNTEAKLKKLEERSKAFLEDWKQTMLDLNKRHEYKAEDGSIMSFEMLPKLQANEFSIQSVFGIGHTRREEVKVGKDAPEQVGKEPKADGQPDSND
jgi:hypothetical protein